MVKFFYAFKTMDTIQLRVFNVHQEDQLFETVELYILKERSLAILTLALHWKVCRC